MSEPGSEAQKVCEIILDIDKELDCLREESGLANKSNLVLKSLNAELNQTAREQHENVISLISENAKLKEARTFYLQKGNGLEAENKKLESKLIVMQNKFADRHDECLRLEEENKTLRGATGREEMNDKNFLQWIHDRLVHVHEENKNFDYMHKLRAIINNTSSEVSTPNVGSECLEEKRGEQGS